MANLGTLAVNLTANAQMMQSGLQRAQQSINGFSREATSRLSAMGVAVGAAIGGIAANAVQSAINAAMSVPQSLASLGQHFLVTAASAEQLRIQLNVLAGDAEKGARLFAELERFAMATSFSFEEVAAQARTFMALGIKDNEVVDTMTLIGTLAMGDTERMKLLGKAYTDTMSKGTVRAQEMNQFAENNVNVMAALMAATGKSRDELVKMRDEGKITFQDLHNALVGITTGQGQFAGLLDAMMQTTTGRWQAFTERLDMVSRNFGEKLLPYANRFLDFLEESGPKIEQFADKMSSATVTAIDKMITLADVVDSKVLPAVNRLVRAGKNIMQNPLFGGLIMGAAGNLMGKVPAIPAAPAGAAGRVQPGGGVGNINPMPPAAAAAPFQAPDAAAATIGLPMFNLFGQLGDETAKLLDAANAAMVQTPEQRKQEEEKIARRTGGSVLQRGSQEAFSAIINAMRGNKDPSVQATNNVAHILANEVVPAMEAVAANTAGNPSTVVELIG